jgi:hypothetical protein
MTTKNISISPNNFRMKPLILDHYACQHAPQEIPNIDKQKAAYRIEIGVVPSISRTSTFD